MENLDLVPPLVQFGHVHELIALGQTVSVSLSPLDNSLAAFITNNTVPDPTQRNSEPQPVYFASLDAIPSSERRLFITDTLLIFATFQEFLETARKKELEAPGWINTEESMVIIRKLAIDYCNFIKECWGHTSQAVLRAEAPLQFDDEHYRSLYTSFSLFVVLYVPEFGYENAPVGDDLMEWLNIHFIEPSTEEGDHLSSLDDPWEDETFWPYLTRATLRGLSKASVFFLGVLSRHPSEDLQELAHSLAPILATQPRLLDFSAERDFVHATRRWKEKVKALRLQLDRVHEEDRHDGFDNWWERLSDIVGILEGRGEVVQRVCAELGADWKEVCCAWGIFVDPRLRRQDLSKVVNRVLDDLPSDPTNLEDMFHVSLFRSEMSEALSYASQIDRWFAAHLADLMIPLALISLDIDEDSGLSIRDHYVLSYADYLHSDPALWRVTVDYMYSCNDIGRERADEVLIRVPLRLHEQTTEGEAEEQTRAGEIVGVLKDINKTCFDYRREEVRRAVCRIAAQTLVQEKDYGLAVSYCTSAEDWLGLGRVVDRVLDEYIISGPMEFANYAADIAPSLQDLGPQSGPHAVFIYRLMFAVRYSQFQRSRASLELQDAASDLVAMLHEDVAPKSWWAILLCDAVDLLQFDSTLLFTMSDAGVLLRKLEEIFIRTSQGGGEDYLSVLMKTIKGAGEKEALERLKIVRLALARYFARCTVIGLGG